MSKRCYVSPSFKNYKCTYSSSNQCTYSYQSYCNETAKQEREAYEYQVRKHGEQEQE